MLFDSEYSYRIQPVFEQLLYFPARLKKMFLSTAKVSRPLMTRRRRNWGGFKKPVGPELKLMS